MSSKHVKLNRPTNVDLVRNPLIGGSKGTTMAGISPDELEEFEGANRRTPIGISGESRGPKPGKPAQ